MLPPDNLIEMVEYIEFQKKMVEDCEQIKHQMALVSENIVVIGKVNLTQITCHLSVILSSKNHSHKLTLVINHVYIWYIRVYLVYLSQKKKN